MRVGGRAPVCNDWLAILVGIGGIFRALDQLVISDFEPFRVVTGFPNDVDGLDGFETLGWEFETGPIPEFEP
jgi:hypothetical protein